MKVASTSRFRREFHPFLASERAQAAFMQLPPGGNSAEELSNEHPRSEQWLYVISGKGAATVISPGGPRRTVKLRAGVLLAIETGELHQIRNTGSRPLRTVNLYVPPAYRADGSLRRRSKRQP
jgi:oxalate decarboxylase/phosphoglucose isomerase-like protein (cupin superfamily)